jgi:hypothetical protein
MAVMAGKAAQNFEGDARKDQLGTAGLGDSPGDLGIVKGVDRGAIDDRNAGQRLNEFRKGRTPHAVTCGGGDDDRQLQSPGGFG